MNPSRMAIRSVALEQRTSISDYIHFASLTKGHLTAIIYPNNFIGFDFFQSGRCIGHLFLELVNEFVAFKKSSVSYVILIAVLMIGLYFASFREVEHMRG